MDVLDLLIYILATWRISSLLVNEDGPWFIFERLRTWSGIYYHTLSKNYHVDPDEYIKVVPDKFLPQLLSCVWCCSIWAGIVFVIFIRLSPWGAFYFALPFALSAGAIVLNLVVEKLQ